MVGDALVLLVRHLSLCGMLLALYSVMLLVLPLVMLLTLVML